MGNVIFFRNKFIPRNFKTIYDLPYCKGKIKYKSAFVIISVKYFVKNGAFWASKISSFSFYEKRVSYWAKVKF